MPHALVDESQARQAAAWLRTCPAARSAFEVAREYCELPVLTVGVVVPSGIEVPLRHGVPHEVLPGPSQIAAHLVETGEALLVLDARRDARFTHHAFVQHEPFARLIAAAPVFDGGEKPIGGVVGFDPEERTDGMRIRRRVERIAHLMSAILIATRARGRSTGTRADAPAAPPGTSDLLAALESAEARRVVTRLGRRWGLQILLAVARRGSARFNRIAQDLPGINSRTLSDRLRELEEDGFVTRRQFSEVPVRVEYALTPAGEHLLESVGSLVRTATAQDDPAGSVTS